jgi:hypothetical protein
MLKYIYGKSKNNIINAIPQQFQLGLKVKGNWKVPPKAVVK